MHSFGRDRQVGVDGRGERVDQFRPARIEYPQGAGAVVAEVPFARTGFTINDGMVDALMLGAFHGKRFGAAAEVDGVAATAGGFAADGTVAALVGVRVW